MATNMDGWVIINSIEDIATWDVDGDGFTFVEETNLTREIPDFYPDDL